MSETKKIIENSYQLGYWDCLAFYASHIDVLHSGNHHTQ